MKNLPYIFAAIFSISVIISCDDYVDELPEGQQNSENYFNTPDEYNAALIGVYDLMGTTYLNQILGEIASDNALCGGENSTDVLAWQQIDDMTHTPDNDQLRRIFQLMYAGIARANYIMEFRDKIDFDGKDQIIAETQFLRSYYYFELIKYFGDVAYAGDRRLTLEETQSIERTPKAEVYAQLEITLNEAIPNLPWQQTQGGRATKGAALALLGKIYLYQEKFADAANALDQVIQSGQYQLLNNYPQIFDINNENNAESVFEVQYFGNEGAGFECFQCAEGNIAVGFGGPRFNGGDFSPFASGYAFNIPTQDLYNAFGEDELRRDNSIFDIEAFVQENPDVTYTEGYEHTGYFNRKYIPYNVTRLPDVNLTHPNNYRAIRYADVLLMAAEAYNRGGLGDATAQNYVNQVRNRAELGNLTSTGQTLTQDIWHERRLELAGEGHRFFDQVRTGQTSTIPGFVNGKHELFPIPLIEIELAGNNWEQNPGY